MITIRSGQTAIQDPNDALVYALDWDENLATGVELVDEGVISIVADEEASPALSDDELALVSGNRSARVRLSGGTLGTKYRVSHRITTNEAPDQTKERSFYVLIQNK